TEADVQIDWAGGPSPVESNFPPAQGTRPRADFAAAVETLQRRADQEGAAAAGNGSMAGSVVSAEGYIQKLNAIAYEINQISIDQERAIADMQIVQAQLAQVYPAVDHQGQPMPPPYLDAQRAVIASAEVDSWGNVVLAYRTITPNLPASEAARPRPISSQASHIANPASSPVRGVWNSLVSDVETLGHEPAQLLAQLGRTVWGVALDVAQRVRPRPTRPRISQRTASQPPGAFGQGRRGGSLSLVDSMLWFGGGVIGRLALILLIGAFPALWSLAVAAMTAMTAYAMYRATLAPQLAFGPALRVALVVVGLIVGGQL
ncbi:MAG: hypothetical protein WBG32_09070, partial [Nodosilinea sp.]